MIAMKFPLSIYLSCGKCSVTKQNRTNTSCKIRASGDKKVTKHFNLRTVLYALLIIIMRIYVAPFQRFAQSPLHK